MDFLCMLKNKISVRRSVDPETKAALDKDFRRRGWAFIDALIGITILAVGIVAIILAITHNTKVVSLASNHTKATYLAQQKLEELKKYDGGTTAPVLPENETSGIFGVSYSLATATLPTANVTPVQVTITWNEEGKSNTVSLGAYYYHK